MSGDGTERGSSFSEALRLHGENGDFATMNALGGNNAKAHFTRLVEPNLIRLEDANFTRSGDARLDRTTDDRMSNVSETDYGEAGVHAGRVPAVANLGQACIGHVSGMTRLVVGNGW